MTSNPAHLPMDLPTLAEGRLGEILQASAQEFRRKGYHAASMADIARAVGLRKASLYHHIEGKQQILFALLERAMDLLIEDTESVLAASLPAADGLRQIIETYVRRLTAQPDLAAVLLFEFRSLDRERLQQHIARRDQFESLWRQLLQNGIASGAYRDLDARLAGFAILGSLNWMLTWYRPDGAEPPESIAARFADLFLSGLQPRASGAEEA